MADPDFFRSMRDGSVEEWARQQPLELAHLRDQPRRIMAALGREESDLSYRELGVSVLFHSLQTASRAEEDGADLELIVAALVHDIGQDLAFGNHSQVAASVLRPYVRAEITWVINMHGLFQKQFYADHYGLDATGHLAYRDHPWFASCQNFCERWDQMSFDPDYPTRPLSHFEPMVQEIFSRTPFDPLVIGAGSDLEVMGEALRS